MNALIPADEPDVPAMAADPDPLAACPMHRPVRSRPARVGLIALGWAAFALGTLGLFLPLLPTFVFWLLAAWAWARAKPALSARLLAHPRLGPPLHAYLCYGRIARSTKRAAIGGMTLSLGLSALLLSPPPVVLAGLASVWLACSAWIASRPEPHAAAVVAA